MTRYAALLRAVNVGGTGKLSMTELVKICERVGFTEVKTYIQSGNVVFNSGAKEPKVKQVLTEALTKKLGKPAAVLVRTGSELDAILAHNPFPDQPTNRVLVMFFDAPLSASLLADVKGRSVEELVLCGRELYIHYPQGQGTSKLKVPLSDQATARNLNTVAKLAAMASER